ncbi:unnamed protein product [Pleuronectes platessa]|uniref:Uncharacterized protein n=1 Tax=Pleuronectes platessa TaxID=8262 RepID=A0A9N7VT63_PLEPL|nr:unnamed protein product [Pleuronectes platessa]
MQRFGGLAGRLSDSDLAEERNGRAGQAGEQSGGSSKTCGTRDWADGLGTEIQMGCLSMRTLLKVTGLEGNRLNDSEAQSEQRISEEQKTNLQTDEDMNSSGFVLWKWLR